MKYPTPPSELVHARMLKLSDLLPWEFDAYPADTMYLAHSVLGAYHEAQADAKAQSAGGPNG